MYIKNLSIWTEKSIPAVYLTGSPPFIYKSEIIPYLSYMYMIIYVSIIACLLIIILSSCFNRYFWFPSRLLFSDVLKAYMKIPLIGLEIMNGFRWDDFIQQRERIKARNNNNNNKKESRNYQLLYHVC